MKDLKNFFEAKSIAIIGVSRDPNKLGSVMFRNLVDGDYKGKVFPINPKYDYIGEHKCYKSVLDVKEKIDLVMISIPAKYVSSVIDECAKKKIGSAVIVSAGFKEVGNKDMEEELLNKLRKNNINAIGPNCLGVYNSYTGVDSLFLPRYRLNRPNQGGIAFVCQSGAVGSAILDLAIAEGQKFSKFISYGNAMDVDESDLIEYLGQDKKTNVICVYIEGVKDGRKFYEVLKKVCKKKPVIVVKGGATEAGAHATMSHTGSVAGSYEVFRGALKQANAIEANSLEEMMEYGRIFENKMKPRGPRVQIITNGGGFGVMASDAVYTYGLSLADMTDKSKVELKKSFRDYYVIKNPLDLTGGSTTSEYKSAIDGVIKDNNVDVVLVISLVQVPTLTMNLIDVITNAAKRTQKPVVSVVTGAEYSQMFKNSLESNGVSSYTYPENAVRAISKMCEYYGVEDKFKKK